MSRKFLGIRILLVLMVIAVSLTGTSALAQGATVVRVDPASPSVQVNDTVSLTVKVDNISNLSAIELHLSFNPAILEVVNVTNGGFVVADFTAQNVFDNAAGTIDYAVAQMGRAPAQGSGTLLNISFRAKSNGTSTVTLRATPAAPNGLLLSNSDGMAIQASWVAGSVIVGTSTSGTPTSTPTMTPTPTNTPTGTISSSATPTPTITPTPTTSASGTPTPTFTNTSAPTITPTPTFTPTPTPSTTVSNGAILGTHVVRFGEYLYCIGRAYGVSPWAIAQVNGIWWPYLIFPNQTLQIPNVTWSPIPAGPVCSAQFNRSSTPTTSPTLTPTPTPTPINSTPGSITPTNTPTPTMTAYPSYNCRSVYYVVFGDTLYSIAVRYGTSYDEIARANQISNARLIYPGQRLCIP